MPERKFTLQQLLADEDVKEFYQIKKAAQEINHLKNSAKFASLKALLESNELILLKINRIESMLERMK